MVKIILKKYKEAKRRIASINWEVPSEKELAYLSLLKSERAKYPDIGLYDSIYQYKCQVYGMSKSNLFFLHCMSLMSFFYVFLKGVFCFPRLAEHKDCVYFHDLHIFSRDRVSHKKLVFVDNDQLCLMVSDCLFLMGCFFKSGCNFVLLATAAFRVGQIRYAINKYGIHEVWSSMEYSCACGVLYDYCLEKNICLKNTMHGEKLLTLRDAFTRFHEFYVWDKHYEDMFKILNCNSKFCISNPWIVIPKEDTILSGKVCYFLKGIESIEEIQKIRELLFDMQNRGFEIYVKKHPRQLNRNEFGEGFQELTHFDNKVEELYVFDFVIAQYSTILFQCYHNNQQILIDNISNPQLFNHLKEREFYFSNANFENLWISSFLLRNHPVI